MEKIQFHSALSQAYSGFGDARAELSKFMLDQLTELAETLPRASTSGTNERGSQSGLPKTAFALVIEVASEFSVRIFRAREPAEDAERKFRDGHQELVEYGEISSDVIDISQIMNEHCRSEDPPTVFYFRVYSFGDDFQILLDPSEAGLASARTNFELRHGDHLLDYLVGTGITCFPQSP
ncbi:hypothetical protein [Nitrobacter sp.]|uniref:hypothetical protein n=1 Tax=Nitrobacter sp. TaxID=29420 RepID=UPI002620536F|nr:hypothetical protein [Nitrobacter sp.]